MYKTTNKDRVSSWRRYNSLSESNSLEVQSLEDIPDFDSVEAEVHWWRRHRLSQHILDEIPQEDDED